MLCNTTSLQGNALRATNLFSYVKASLIFHAQTKWQFFIAVKPSAKWHDKTSKKKWWQGLKFTVQLKRRGTSSLTRSSESETLDMRREKGHNNMNELNFHAVILTTFLKKTPSVLLPIMNIIPFNLRLSSCNFHSIQKHCKSVQMAQNQLGVW